jgi:CheY-like chemotaxis protein
LQTSGKSENIREQILVADDDPSVLKLIKAVVEDEGYGVVTARDGREAISLLLSGELFAGAILDIKMPHVEGIELVKYMKSDSRSKKIPVIIMTAEQSLLLMSESYASGAVAFLPKPFNLSQLRSILRTFVVKTKAQT